MSQHQHDPAVATPLSAPPAPATPTSPPAALVQARGLGLRGSRGPVYTGVDLTLRANDLLAVAGPVGSGRTSLLLTLAGRMRPSEGTLVVAGQHLPHHRAKIQRMTALAEIPTVNDLDPRMTVGEHLRERLALSGPWHLGLSRPAVRRARAHQLLDVLDALEPGDRVRWDTELTVGALPAPARWRLGLALALADHPRLVAVDDLDTLGDADDVAAAWRLLRRLADTGVTVVAACTDPERIPADVACTVHRLDAPRSTGAAGPAAHEPALSRPIEEATR